MSETCTWTLDDPDCSSWVSSCGEEFIIIEGTPEHNGMKFCCYCGKPIPAPIERSEHGTDGERARDLCGVGCGCTEEQSETCGFFREGLCHQMPDSISAAFASIRAEGSAERAKLEGALRGRMFEAPGDAYEEGWNCALEVAAALAQCDVCAGAKP